MLNANLYSRKTIASPFSIEGVGVHKNEISKLNFLPAKPETGIIFRRYLNKKRYDIPALVNFISDTIFSVSIAIEGIKIQTIEHLMFAIYASHITDLIISIDRGSEIPILDGSALPYVEAFEKAGFQKYQQKIQPITISKEIMVGTDTRYLKIKPHSSLSIHCTIDFPHPMLKKSCVFTECTPSLLKEKVAPARTFGFLNQAEDLKKKGYALGASTENTLVFTEKSSLNSLRFAKEPIYHKILDILGDLSLLGRPIKGHIEAYCSGHSLDIQLVQKILEQEK